VIYASCEGSGRQRSETSRTPSPPNAPRRCRRCSCLPQSLPPSFSMRSPAAWSVPVVHALDHPDRAKTSAHRLLTLAWENRVLEPFRYQNAGLGSRSGPIMMRPGFDWGFRLSPFGDVLLVQTQPASGRLMIYRHHRLRRALQDGSFLAPVDEALSAPI